MCEDYRAAASIDLDHDDAADHDRKLSCPVLVLWGANGVVHRCFRPLEDWREVAEDVRGEALPSGHDLPEEVPDATCDRLLAFFGGGR
jgi:haloacetate dehalogenase